MEIKWISGDGGPHILMERRYLDLWTDQREVLYEKACQIDDHIGNLQLPDISLIVICDHEDKGAKLTPGSWTDGAKLD